MDPRSSHKLEKRLDQVVEYYTNETTETRL